MPQTSLPQTCSHRLHGSYEVMRGGHMNEAFVDFTGGVGEVLYLRQDTPGLFSALRHALAKESLVGATALVRVRLPWRTHVTRTHQDQPTVTAEGGVLCPSLIFHYWLIFSHKSNIEQVKKIFVFTTNELQAQLDPGA